MKDSAFISYIGPPEIHDGSILRHEHNNNHLVIFVRDYDGAVWEFAFSGVAELVVNHADGMVLYALAEFAAVAPLRRFVFINWDEESDASLVIEAQYFHVIKTADTA